MGISFIYSISTKGCDNKKIKINKAFKDLATKEQSTIDWFHGLKLHIIINDSGELWSISQVSLKN